MERDIMTDIMIESYRPSNLALIRTIINFALFIIFSGSVISILVGIIYLILGKISYQDNLQELEAIVKTDKN